jgi:hypothetical protein
VRAGADDPRRPLRRRAPRRRSLAMRGATACARRPENLQIDVLVPRIDRDGDRGLVVVGDIAARHRRQRRQADAGLAAASAMPRAAAMPTRMPVKLPGPVVTAMRSMRGNGMSALRMTRRDQRHQRFGVAAQHRQRLRSPAAALGVEHGGGAGLKRGIDREHTHGDFSTQDYRECHSPPLGEVAKPTR